MKLLLASLQSNTDAIGLKSLHAHVVAHGVDSTLVFLPHLNRARLPAVERFLRRQAPDVVGVSLMSSFLPAARLLTAAVRRALPGATLVWGGAHPTCDPEGSLRHADYVFVGEAEGAFPRFLDALEQGRPVDQVPGLAWLEDGAPRQTAVAPLARDLDGLPAPEHHPAGSFVLHRGEVAPLTRRLFRRHARFSGHVYSLATMRGCPYNCAYCCNSVLRRLHGPGAPRRRSVGVVMDELKLALARHPDLLMVKSVDECFLSHDMAWLEEFARRYRAEVGLPLLCHTAPAHCSDEKLALLKRAGVAWLLMGLQSGSERVNREVYNRKMPPEQFLEAAQRIQRHGIAGLYDVILDNPYETEAEQLQTIALLGRVPRPYLLQLYSLTFLPGTDLHRRAIAEGRTVEDPATKHYHRVRPTPLNQATRLAPLLPAPLLGWLTARRDNAAGRVALRMIHAPAVTIMEPLVWMRMLLGAQDGGPAMAARLIAAIAGTGIKKVLLGQPA